MFASCRGLSILVLLSMLSMSALGASRGSFCKCTCKTNSTIIPLNGGSSSNLPEEVPEDDVRGRTCEDCNRKFCLSYNLPALEDCLVENKGKEEEIFTTCFQRDSAKDQAVVYTFIFVTVGLLVYAGVEPYLEKRFNVGSSSRSSVYTAVPPAQEGLQ